MAAGAILPPLFFENFIFRNTFIFTRTDTRIDPIRR